MFPQIAKKKKKEFIVDETVGKQWEESLRDLEIRSKGALKRIPTHILQDFSKVCRIKSIPEFYANYFICHTHRIDPQQLPQVYAEEIEKLLTNSSYFHKINQALRQRQELIQGLKSSLLIVEGFLLMNQNKAVPLHMKTSIDGFVNDCVTLEELKDLQRKKTEALAMDIIRVRTNTTQLIQLVHEWRKELQQLSKNDGGRRMKAIYPHQAINCLLMPLYDMLFLKTSLIKSEVSFGKEEHDPFLQHISKSKRGSHIQHYLLDYLKADTSDYSNFTKAILQEMPSDEAQRLKEKQQELEQKKQQRIKEQKLKQEKLKALREERESSVRIRRYSSLKSVKEGQGRALNIKTSKGERSDRKIINVDKLIRTKDAKKSKGEMTPNEPLTENESKILGVYKKGKKQIMQQSTLVQKDELLQEKRLWEKSIKEEKEEKEKIRKLLRQTEKKALQQTKQFETKLKKYQDEVHNLKNRIQMSKKQSRVLSSTDKPKGIASPLKKQKLVISAYKSERDPNVKDSGVSMLESKLMEQSKTKRHLQKQIKELAQQKQKLEKLVNRQNTRTIKQLEISKRQMEKYEQVISKLKNESDESRRIIQELELSKISEERKEADTQRNNKIVQREHEMKRAIQRKIEEKEKIGRAYQSNKKQQSQRSQSKKRQSLINSRMENKQNTSQIRDNAPDIEILKSKLEEQSRAKKSLQSQIKQLGQQKLKLEKLIEKQSFRNAKDGEKFSKKIQKYEETINRLKKESDDSRRIMSEIESSKIAEQRKQLQKSRVASVIRRQQDLKRKIQQKIQQRQRRKQIQRSKLQESKRSQQRSSSFSKHQEAPGSGDDVEIIKTKQTIEIVFEPRRKRAHPSKQLVQAESKLVRLQKQRELLQKKLELTIADKKEKVQLKHKQIERSDISERLKGQMEKERAKNERLEENIKKMRASISSQYELKLNKEKVKYEKDREELIKIIQKEREQKRTKDKILDQQMSFLREMEKKEDQLFQLLQSEKRQKVRKQQILAKEIEQKQELMNLIEIEEIKKNIEREVRKQIEEVSSEDEEDIQHWQRKAELEQQIQQLRMEKEQEIEQMNDQNQKLKELIADLKAEQTHLLEAIKENIQMESQTQKQETDAENTIQPNKSQTPQAKERVTIQQLQQRNQKLQEELQSKTMIQFKNEEKKKEQYARITTHDHFHEKEKIENLVEFYLRSPQHYPGEAEAKLKDADKKQIVQITAERAKKVQQFQSELFSLRQLPEFVPTLKNDSVNNHLLNLREAYEDYEADALRRQLFPPLEDEVYGEKELSFQSQEPPINTLMDEVKAHLHKYPQKKEDKNKKNFLAINRVRLAVLQDSRKEKQRLMIEEESKKKIQRQLFEKRRKEREENFIRQRQRENEQKQKKREDIYRSQKARIQKDRQSEQKRKQEKRKQKRRKQELKQNKERQLGSSRQKKSKRQSSKESDTEINRSKKRSDKKSESQSSQTDQLNSENEAQKEKQLIQDASMLPIKEEQVEHSLQQQQAQIANQVQQVEQDLKKRERELLKSEVKQVQQEVRAYIKEEEQFIIYQQFVNQTELLQKIQEILDLSSSEMKSINGNQTIMDDIQLYSSIAILVAKNSKGLEVGLAVLHKEFDVGTYVCDYLLAHKMENFLNLGFNFSRFLFQNDPYAQKIEFIFDIKSVTETQTLRHFLDFEKKCRRLGEVYIKAKSQTERKYVLKRTLFEATEETQLSENGGVRFNLNLSLCGNILTQINSGYKNTSNFNYSSFNVILAYYLSRKHKKLVHFREKAQTELLYRQLLVTALLFHKKQFEIKNFTLIQRANNDLNSLLHLKEKFDLADVDGLDETELLLTEKLPQLSRRCTLQVGMEQVNYLLLSPEEAVTSIQSSNSSQTGYFISVIPKYKLMVIEAEEFLTMSSKNPDLTAFFYIKHFIKNIVDVKKEKYSRIYVPEVQIKNQFHFADISRRLGETVLLSEDIQIGWKSKFPNSVLYTPHHEDLVIQRPFIIALLSGNVERAVQGSPICVQLIA